MSEIAISVEHIDKVYSIGLKEKKTDTLFGSIAKTISAPVRNFRNLSNLSKFKNLNREDVFYALKDVSFNVLKGEAIAIIGHNGAGKSTLLKIISRITDPSAGCIKIYGRVSSLLEVGTGFHPELTGRENIYLNGTILGMRKNEIDTKLDEIIDFAGVEKFIDTPVKRYSSGMRVRLAFSVAAHLEAEMLLIDEVLAVGDAAFQKKCLGKMNDVTSQGRTVLFVSHNMGAVKELCTKGIVLKAGAKVFEGSIQDSITNYFEQNSIVSELEERPNSPLTVGTVLINGKLNSTITPEVPINVTLPLICKNIVNPKVIFIIEDFLGRHAVELAIKTNDIGFEILDGEQLINLNFPPLWLAPGIYSAYFKILIQGVWENHKGRFVSEKNFFEVKGDIRLEKSGFYTGEKTTLLAPYVNWEFIKQ